MSVTELKLTVINKITNFDDESVLKKVLALLQDNKGAANDSYNLSRNYKAIKEQYGDVLQKLAQ